MLLPSYLLAFSLLFASSLAASEPPAAPRSKDFPRCIDPMGQISFHQTACPPGTRQDGTVKLQVSFEPPAPAPPSPAPKAKPVRPPRPAQPIGPNCTQLAFKCTSANGEVAYRHDACPRFITVTNSVPVLAGPVIGIPGAISTQRQYGYTLLQQSYPVISERVCRDQACEVLNERRRKGQQNPSLKDQQFDTYERNAGRDPCR